MFICIILNIILFCKVGIILIYSIQFVTNGESKVISNKKILDCPVATTINLIGNKWKLLIIRDLLASTRRFGELRKNLEGISQRVLTQNLRELENDGLIKRKVYAEVPPRVEYSLNELGRSLLPIISTMADWGNNYKKNAFEQMIYFG